MDNLNDGPWTVENVDRRISKNNKVGKAVRAISTVSISTACIYSIACTNLLI